MANKLVNGHTTEEKDVNKLVIRPLSQGWWNKSPEQGKNLSLVVKGFRIYMNASIVTKWSYPQEGKV